MQNAILIFLLFNRYLGFDHAATLFHIRDSPADSVERPIYLTNTFNFAVFVHDIILPQELKAIFKVSSLILQDTYFSATQYSWTCIHY